MEGGRHRQRGVALVRADRDERKETKERGDRIGNVGRELENIKWIEHDNG